MTDWSVVDDEPIPQVSDTASFHALMDKTFGKGKWKETGGYRTPERENELRAEGAGTVPKGKLSHHSLGTTDSPGARDIVVDGLNPRQVARKLSDTGADFLHFYPEGKKATQGAHLHVDLNPGEAKPDDKWEIASVDPIPAKAKPAPAAPPKPKTTLQYGIEGQKQNLRDIPTAIGKRYDEAASQYRKDLSAPIKPTIANMLLGPAGPVAEKVGRIGLDLIGAATSPITGLMDATFGKTVEQATGGRVSRETGGDIASMAIPIGGELNTARKAAKLAEEAGVSANTARAILARKPPAAVPVVHAAGDTSHEARVARLKSDGVYITPWAAKGGNAKLIGDKMTSEPHVAQAVMEAQQHSIESMNRTVYNKALRPIGERLGPDVPVGREGVSRVGQMLSNAYRQILPSVRVQADVTATQDVGALRSKAKTLGPAGEAQYNAILEQEILRHMRAGGGVMDGEQFKMAESELSRLSRGLKGSQDHNQRELGHLLDDTADALRSAAERSSPAGIRQRLKAINSGYAIFTRIQDASTRRLTTLHEGEFGVFTPTDLMAAVKKGDRTVRKGAFARGDALLQGFAEDAASVLPNKMPDSGTAGRLRQGRAGGVIGAAVGGVPGAIMGYGADIASQTGTNALARHLLTRARTGSPRNYLKSAQGRLTAGTYGGAGGVSGAAALAGDGGGGN